MENETGTRPKARARPQSFRQGKRHNSKQGGPQPALCAPRTKPTYTTKHEEPVSHEHPYAADENEKNVLKRGDWTYEGIGWVAPVKSNSPVHRLYNPALGDHHYTMDQNEVNVLTRQRGWRPEGIAWYAVSWK